MTTPSHSNADTTREESDSKSVIEAPIESVSPIVSSAKQDAVRSTPRAA